MKLFALFALGACAASPPTDRWHVVVEPGALALELGSGVVELPSTVSAGVAFSIEVYTKGNGCVSPNMTEVAPIPTGIEVIPWDNRRVPDAPNEGCTAELLVFPHGATLTFASAGLQTLLIHGYTDLSESIDVQ